MLSCCDVRVTMTWHGMHFTSLELEFSPGMKLNEGACVPLQAHCAVCPRNADCLPQRHVPGLLCDRNAQLELEGNCCCSSRALTDLTDRSAGKVSRSQTLSSSRLELWHVCQLATAHAQFTMHVASVEHLSQSCTRAEVAIIARPLGHVCTPIRRCA